MYDEDFWNTLLERLYSFEISFCLQRGSSLFSSSLPPRYNFAFGEGNPLILNVCGTYYTERARVHALMHSYHISFCIMKLIL